MTENERTTLLEAINFFGVDKQLDAAIEELTELLLTLVHFKRGKSTVEDILEESVDVSITLDQIHLILGDGQKWSATRKLKLSKLQAHIDSETGARA